MSNLTWKNTDRRWRFIKRISLCSGNKNEALPVIAACLLSDETMILKNVPRIADVEIMLKIIDDLGAQIQ